MNNYPKKVICGGHPLARYVSLIFRLLSNDDELRREAIINLGAIINSPGGKWMLEECRTDVCI